MMNKRYTRYFTFLIVFIMCLAFLPASNVMAKEAPVSFVDDGADLFTEEEELKLSARIQAIQKKYDADVVIYTVEDRGNISSETFVERYVNTNCDLGRFKENVTILFIDEFDRYVEIQGYGVCEEFINNDRIDSILDDIETDLHFEEYFDACSTALHKISYYYGKNPNFLTWTLLHALVALIIGAIVTFVMVSHSKGKVTTNSRTYLDTAHSGLVAKRDMYITTTVKRTRIQSNSSGRSGGGRSSGGRSHSGGGRHF